MRFCFDPSLPLDYEQLTRGVENLSESYPFLTVTTLGKSILGRDIPLLSVGKGKKHILMVGTHHAMEWITGMVLLRFCEEVCEAASAKQKRYLYDVDFCLRSHTYLFVPMLNPDGVEYQIHGVAEENPMRERLLKMNEGSDDFSHWQANARGVDLNHNYDYGFDEYKTIEWENQIPCGAPTRYSGTLPESEPETAALCRLIRSDGNIKLILTLHTQGEEIYYQSGGITAPGTERIAELTSKLTGYKLSKASGLASYGGLTDWYLHAVNRPILTLECGYGENPLPLEDFSHIYLCLREALFTVPMTV